MRLALTLCLVTVATACAADPFVGTCKLDPSRSTFKPGPPPRSLTMVWMETGAGMKVTSTGLRADGQSFRQEYSALYDGKEHARPGPWNFDAVINRQVSETEREDIFKKDGAVVGTSKLTLSDSGRVLTVRFSYGELRDVRVFERQRH